MKPGALHLDHRIRLGIVVLAGVDVLVLAHARCSLAK